MHSNVKKESRSLVAYSRRMKAALAKSNSGHIQTFTEETATERQKGFLLRDTEECSLKKNYPGDESARGTL